MTAADLIAFAQSVFGRMGDALPVLLGGAGGAMLIWWLDGRRQRKRDRRRLIGATLVVGFELSGNIAMADQWASLPDRVRAGEPPETLSAGPIEFRATAWERNQDELARQLPRELVTHIGVSYALSRMLERNAPTAHKRGHLEEDDLRLATRVRDTTQAVLRELQDYERKHLGIKFAFEPESPPETRARERKSSV